MSDPSPNLGIGRRRFLRVVGGPQTKWYREPQREKDVRGKACPGYLDFQAECVQPDQDSRCCDKKDGHPATRLNSPSDQKCHENHKDGSLEPKEPRGKETYDDLGGLAPVL